MQRGRLTTPAAHEIALEASLQKSMGHARTLFRLYRIDPSRRLSTAHVDAVCEKLRSAQEGWLHRTSLRPCDGSRALALLPVSVITFFAFFASLAPFAVLLAFQSALGAVRPWFFSRQYSWTASVAFASQRRSTRSSCNSAVAK